MDSKLEIQKNLYYITQNTSSVSVLMTLLVERDLLQLSEQEEVECGTTHHDRVKRLFLLILKKDPEKSEKVLDSLRRSGNAHVAKKIGGLGTVGYKSSKRRPGFESLTPSGSVDSAVKSNVEIAPVLISLEGTPDKYESFERVMTEISTNLEYLSLKYVLATPKHLLKTFKFCEDLNKIVFHNVSITGMLSRNVQLKCLEDFEYIDDEDANDIKNMEIDDRLQFLQQILFFVSKEDCYDLTRLKINITVTIADYDYIKISATQNTNPFQQIESTKESDIIDKAFEQIDLDRRDSIEEPLSDIYVLNDRFVDEQKFLDMVNNNGEFVNSIKMKGISLQKQTILRYLEKCPNLFALHVEECTIDGEFSVDDRVKLEGLKEFNLSIKDELIGNNTNKIALKFESVVPQIFFFYKIDKKWTLNDIYDQKVNIRLKINAQIMMDLKAGDDIKLQLSYSTPEMTTAITNGAPEMVNRIYFNSLQFPKQMKSVLFKPNLTHFVLRYVFMQNISEFIRDCINLKVLVIFQANLEPIFFSRDLGKLRGLRKISLNNATVKFPIGDEKWPALEDLHLYHCYSHNAPYRANQHFPVLKSFTYDGRNFSNAILLKNLLKLDSISFITLWRFNWIVDQSDSILTETTDEIKKFFMKHVEVGVDDNKRQFSLERADNSLGDFREPKWTIGFIEEYNGPEWQDNEYKHFVFSQFFSS